ncbi:carbohydrate-binding family 9-like protein [Mordavella massiliensis]|uniref:Carbohydrate-binding family 9-like protein n=1 Tax=Mordavella massiliensis TaxID=1871024 RepID=A0A939BGS7_9CLOT|nr:carbohydrate-binding family 9-like protein [Mordavella massiliensis]MBM6948370.1 carbohydrate-binding family 9-like protein [Mordavella massiliensis]
MLNIKIIQNPEELNTVEPQEIRHLLWGTKSAPCTFFSVGFVPGDAFYVRMVCEEKDPLRTYTAHRDPVYRDSAMEAFFLFDPTQGDMETYVNFEMNANGALLAAYGPSRMYRSYFSAEEYEQFRPTAQVEEDHWSISFCIPVSILEQIYGPLDLQAGSRLYCNFYKISETADIEHYAAYSPITSDTPSFHMPEYFADAVLV